MATAHHQIELLTDLERSAAWSIVAGHLESQVEHYRDLLEYDESEAEQNRGVVRGLRGTLSFPSSRMEAAEDFIEKMEEG